MEHGPVTDGVLVDPLRERARELSGVDRHLERLLAVDLHHRDADPVLELELVVPLDVDLLEVEKGPPPLPQDRLAGNVAEVTAGAGVQDDPARGALG